MNRSAWVGMLLTLFSVPPVPPTFAVSQAAGELVVARVTSAPKVDGRADDSCWAQAVPLTTRDRIAGVEIELRAVRTQSELFVLARFPDPTESREHKTLVWNEHKALYESGPQREDTLVLKWSMEPLPIDLSIRGDDSYEADIWYWKAHRTDPVGYADDKFQVYSEEKRPGALRLISKSARIFYLMRSGDQGEAAFRVVVHQERAGERMPKYEHRNPTGSRADVRAKGTWKDGVWTVEFARALGTGHPDDVQFRPPGRYQFGVSRYEIAGRPPDPSLEEPLFGSGDISESLWLVLP